MKVVNFVRLLGLESSPVSILLSENDAEYEKALCHTKSDG